MSRQVMVIRPGSGWFDLDLRALLARHELLYFLVLRELKVRYRQALIGAGWAVIQPVLAALIFTVVFGLFAHLPSDGVPYPLFALTALLPWTYFAEALRRAATGLVDDAELIRKIWFPRLVMPLAGVLSPLVDLAISLVVLAAMMLWYHRLPDARALLAPLFVLQALLLALGTGLWLGPVNVRFRDVKHALPFLIQVWMYASPVVYPTSMVPPSLRSWWSLNPMVGVIEGFRWSLLGSELPGAAPLVVGWLVTLAILASGLLVFRHAERSFADVI